MSVKCQGFYSCLIVRAKLLCVWREGGCLRKLSHDVSRVLLDSSHFAGESSKLNKRSYRTVLSQNTVGDKPILFDTKFWFRLETKIYHLYFLHSSRQQVGVFIFSVSCISYWEKIMSTFFICKQGCVSSDFVLFCFIF